MRRDNPVRVVVMEVFNHTAAAANKHGTVGFHKGIGRVLTRNANVDVKQLIAVYVVIVGTFGCTNPEPFIPIQKQGSNPLIDGDFRKRHGVGV